MNTTTDATPTAHHLSEAEIAILNYARSVLGAVGKRQPSTSSGGRCQEAIENAENAVFRTLNLMCSYAHQPMTDEQLYNGGQSA